MKILALLAMIFATSQADARSLIAHKQFVLSQVAIDGAPTPYVGTLDLDFTKHEIVVVIYNDICHQFTTPPGQIHCMAVAMPVANLRAPLTSISPDGCGSNLYSGFIDQTPMDGVRTEISVVDNSARTCENVIRSLVEVKATVYSPMANKLTTYELLK